MNVSKLYYIRAFYEEHGECYASDHAYFEGDDFIIEDPSSICIYDPEKGITQIYDFVDDEDDEWLPM